ncbi:hypothetical protein UlMin_005722 [Ulmus minor]
MASQENQPHFLLFPLMAQGHMIPMIDIARLLAQKGVKITIVTTPHNAARFEAVLARAIESGLPIKVVVLKFPSQEAGLPEGCENLDAVPTTELVRNFFVATTMLEKPAEELANELKPRPNCIVSDMSLPWTVKIARKLDIPRISFFGVGCFCLYCMNRLFVSKVHEKVSSETEFFVIPGLPDPIEINKSQLPGPLTSNLKDFGMEMLAAEMESYGVIMNTFEELEPAYVQGYKKVKKDKVWCVGPVSLCNKNHSDKAQRGNKSSIDEDQCLKWLDSWNPSSVVYASLGSMCNVLPSQLIELGLGLEASNKPFIWVMRGGSKYEQVQKWIVDDGFEERIKGRGLLIRGWAPQVLILSHPSVGGFLTHCGWNSTLEGISAGLPMITWPLFADQFLNEKLVVQVLNIAISLGVKVPLFWGDEEKVGVLVKSETIKNAIEQVMDEGEESKGRRERAKKLGEMAKTAAEEGGSSQLNIKSFIEQMMQVGKSDQTEKLN